MCGLGYIMFFDQAPRKKSHPLADPGGLFVLFLWDIFELLVLGFGLAFHAGTMWVGPGFVRFTLERFTLSRSRLRGRACVVGVNVSR